MTQQNATIKKDKPTVVIVGRINVGKSSLFNRLTSSAQALVSDIEGTTRDRNHGIVEWQGKSFQLVDTGGVDIDLIKNSIAALTASTKKSKKILDDDSIDNSIIRQTRQALQDADLVLFVVDGRAGVMPEDRELARVLQQAHANTLLICNKIDNQKIAPRAAEFYSLGVGEPILVSARNGSRSGDLLDVVIKNLKFRPGRKKAEVTPAIKVALLGKPNVGKSSLVNKILGHERVIVSPEAQTTREPQDTIITYEGKELVLIDTAGLRKNTKKDGELEELSAERTAAVIKKADVVLLVTESDKDMSVQDRVLGGMLKESGTGVILIANKWDQIEDKDEKAAAFALRVYREFFPHLAWAPILFTSATSGHGVNTILKTVCEVAESRAQELSEKKLGDVLYTCIRKHRPAKAKGTRPPRLLSLKQVRSAPPVFELLIGKDDTVHFSYIRFIENQIREVADFVGVPIQINVRTRR